jgi:hypothetical protein
MDFLCQICSTSAGTDNANEQFKLDITSAGTASQINSLICIIVPVGLLYRPNDGHDQAVPAEVS